MLFEAVPGLYLVLAKDLRIVAVSDEYLRATMTRREDILGRPLFQVFPDNPDDPGADGVRNLRASLERVLATRASDVMPIQKYDIRRPESEGGGFEERHWSPMNSPVLGPDGHLVYIIHRVEDVTEFARLQRAGAEQARATDRLRSQAQRMEAEALQRSQEIQRVRAIVEAAPCAMVVTDQDGKVLVLNEEVERLFGHRREDLLGRSAEVLIPASARGGPSPLHPWVQGSDPRSRIESVGLRRDGTEFAVEVATNSAATNDGPILLVAIADISERKRAQERQRIMVAELDHRVKNNLSVVLSLASFTLESAKTLEEFAATFLGRIAALARVHSSLAKTKWEGTLVRDLVVQAVQAHVTGANQVTAEGPDVLIPGMHGQTLCLALHELATNACKYGALSRPGGHVLIRWSVAEATADGRRFELSWTESGGPKVQPPSHRGFGSQLIEDGLAYEWHADTKMDFAPEGLRCTVVAPLPKTT